MAKRKLSPKARRRWVIIAFLTGIVYMGSLLIQQEMKLHDQAQQKSEIQQQIANYQDRNQAIVYDIEHISSNEAIAKAVREKLGFVLPNELVFYPKTTN